MADRVCRRGKKENRAISSDTCVDHYILLLKYLSNHIHFIVNGLYIGFEALHGEVSMYIWFAVTPCVYLLAS